MADNKILISIWSVEEQQSTNDAASIATMLKAIVHNEVSLPSNIPPNRKFFIFQLSPFYKDFIRRSFTEKDVPDVRK